MHNEVPLFQNIYDFYKLFYLYIDHFPKKSREVLGRKIESTILELLELISQASFAEQNQKINNLLNASVKLDFLKVLFRLTFDLKIIDQKKYIFLEEKLQEIGRMLGGWIKSIKSKNPNF
jgi:hypothetical protein